MKLPPYPKYKPSGVEWLGDVPEHWEVKRLKFVASMNDDVLREDTEEDFELEYVDIGSVDRNAGITSTERMFFESAPSRARRRVIDGDTIVSTVRTYLRAVTPIENPPDNLVVSTGFAVVRPRKVDAAFAAAGLRSSYFIETVVSRSVGVSYPATSSTELGNIFFPLPDASEQRAIADFLDERTGKLDALAEKKRGLIEKLKEKRSALIARTVTRGLPPEAMKKYPQISQIYADEKAKTPKNLRQSASICGSFPGNPPLKPSGIDWLGDIPEHWEAAQLRRKAQILDCKHRTVSFIDDGIPLASIREVHGFEVDLTNAKQTSEAEYLALIEGNRRPCVGDIIYSRNATVGEAALVSMNERFCMGQDVCLIRPTKHHPKYLLYLFRSAPLTEQVESLMIGSTFRRINVGQIHGFWICVPPLPEQTAIADYLDRETAKIDRMIAKVEAALKKLAEYRTALITAAVTGKIDVRPTR